MLIHVPFKIRLLNCIERFHKTISCEDDYYRIAYHPASGHVVLAGYERGTDRLTLAIYTVNGEFVRRIQLDEKVFGLGGITVTVEGHIAVALQAITYEGIHQVKVIVV